jgi:hypothetical protein
MATVSDSNVATVSQTLTATVSDSPTATVSDSPTATAPQSWGSVPPDAAGGGLFSVAIVATTAATAVGLIVIVIVAAVACKRRRRREKIPDKDEEMRDEPSSAYTLSVEDGRYLISDCDDIARVDARPPVPEESDGLIFSVDSDVGDGPLLPGRASWGGTGRQSVMMRGLLNPF